MSDLTPQRVLVPLLVVLLSGIVTATVQAGDSGDSENVLPPLATTAPPTTTEPPPTAPPAVPTTTAPPTTPQPTTSPATVPPPPTQPQTQPPPTTTAAPTTTTPAPTPTSTSPTPTTTPFEPGPSSTGTFTLDGVRLRVEVDRSAARVGDVVRATTTVTNTRPTAIFYTSRCPSQITVRAETGVDGSPSKSWTGDRNTFKELALTSLQGAGNSFVPAAQLDDASPEPCVTADPPLLELAAGASLTEEHAWKAATAYGSEYDGQAPVTAAFRFGLTQGLDGSLLSPSTVETSAPLRLVGEGNDLVPPTVAVDTALAQTAFAEVVEDGDSAVWVSASVRLVVRTSKVYEVRLVRPDRTAVARVLATTGQAVGGVTVT